MLLRIVLFLSLCLTQCWGQTCDAKRTERIDESFARLMFFGGGLKLPENRADLKGFCNRHLVDLKEVEEYKNDCLIQRAKQLIGVVIYSTRNAFFNKYCKGNTKSVTEFLENVPCISSTMKEVEKCNMKLIDNLIGIRYAPERLRLPHTCCEYHAYFECCQTSMSKKCSQRDREFGLNLMRVIFGKMTDVMCGEYNKGSEKCKAIGKTPKRKKGQKRNKSFIIPIIEVMLSLGDEQFDNPVRAAGVRGVDTFECRIRIINGTYTVMRDHFNCQNIYSPPIRPKQYFIHDIINRYHDMNYSI